MVHHDWRRSTDAGRAATAPRALADTASSYFQSRSVPREGTRLQTRLMVAVSAVPVSRRRVRRALVALAMVVPSVVGWCAVEGRLASWRPLSSPLRPGQVRYTLLMVDRVVAAA